MKILCVGSLNIDRVYSVPHFVRAGETLASTAFAQVPGGKGLNQAVAQSLDESMPWLQEFLRTGKPPDRATDTVRQ